MRKYVILIMLALACAPVLAQFYSYRDANGKMIITDRPIKKKGVKLVKKYKPPSMREKERQEALEQAKTDRRLRQSAANARGKYVLTKAQIDGLVAPIARSMRVDPDLVKAVIQIESGRDARIKSHKGAMGLMQLIPETAKRFGVTNPWDPRQNVKGGISYLRYLLGYFEGDVDLVLAAYNAGENAVDRHGGIPPYKETQRYVKKIRRLYNETSLPYDKTIKYRSKLIKKKKQLQAETKVARAD